MGEEDMKQPENTETTASEQMRRNIEFIAHHQAQFAADMRRLSEAQTRAEERQTLAEQRQARAEQMWERTEEGIRSLLAIAQIHEQEINALSESQARLSESQAHTDRQMAETDERINALVNTVERIISERRNGRQG